MTGRAHRECLRSTHSPKLKPAATKPDGAKEDFQGMMDTAVSNARSGEGKGRPGDSGSDILDYQKPYEQTSKKRSRG